MWVKAGCPEGEDQKFWFKAMEIFDTRNHSWKNTNAKSNNITIYHRGQNEFILHFMGLREELFTTWEAAVERAEYLIAEDEILIINHRGSLTTKQLIEAKLRGLGMHTRCSPNIDQD